jgi:pimeloyl-ACP methyl ester carboxylesterase
MIPLSSDETFHFELLRTLALSRYGGADIAETLETASQIIPGDFESYYSAFNKRAEHVLSQAEKLTSPVSARDAYFRASSYFRAADFYLHGIWDDPRIMSLWEKQTYCFDKATTLLPVPPHPRKLLPADGFKVANIFFPVTVDESIRRPTIVVFNGFDGSMEEAYHQFGIAALERGYNVMVCEGPGQPSVRRYQGVGFTHEWEKVLTPLLDHLETLPNVDISKVLVIGNSMGALLAARAAAFEHRMAAVAVIDGVYNLGQSPSFSAGAQLPGFEPGKPFDIKTMIIDNKHLPTTMRWAISHGLWAFNVKTPDEFLERAQKWSVVELTDKIQCPVFIGNAVDDMFFQGQPEQLRDALGDKAHYVEFTAEDAASSHCHVGAFTFLCQNLYDWFEGIVGKTGA